MVERDAETFEHVLRRYKRMQPGEVVPPREVTGFLNGTECEPRSAPERGRRRHGPRDRLRGGPRDPPAGRRPAAGHSRPSRARPRGPRRRARAQVRDPRLAGFHYDVELAEFRRVAAASRRANAPVYFLRRHQAFRRCRSRCRPSSGSRSPPGTSPLALRDSREAAAGAEVIAQRHGRLRGPEHERPHEGAAPRRGRGPALLPPRLLADEPRARREVPQDPGEARSPRGARTARAGRFAPAAATTLRRTGRRRETRTRRCARPSPRPSTCPACP